MTVHPRSSDTNRFPLFTQFFEDLDGKSILDYGSGSGNLLYFSDGAIAEQNYIGIDVSSDAIKQATDEFPTATFLHNDRYNWMYNHNGTQAFIYPSITQQVDYVWAYSVFSHTDYNELQKAIKWFKSLGASKIVLSILDINGKDMLKWFSIKRIESYGSCYDLMSLSPDTDIAYLLNNDVIVDNSQTCAHIDCEFFIALYNLDWLITQLQADNISATIAHCDDSYVPFLVINNV
jgi:SAM-dependent methyltransferase